MRTLLIRAAFAAVAFSALAAQAAAPAMTAETAKGPALVDAKSMTLYTFDKDMGGKSMCNGPCATNWPALMAASGSAAASSGSAATASAKASGSSSSSAASASSSTAANSSNGASRSTVTGLGIAGLMGLVGAALF